MKNTAWTLALVTCIAAVPFFIQAQPPAPADAKPALLPGLDNQLIDTNADPCTNFFQYACGNFPKLYPIPSDQASHSTFNILFNYTEYTLHSLLEKVAVDKPSRTPNEQKIGDYYASCMDSSAVNSLGLKPLQPGLDRIAALTDKKQLTDLLAHYQLIGVNAFLNLSEQQDFKDARNQIAAVDQGGLGLPERDYYLRPGADAEKTRQQYVQHIANMLKLMGEPDDKA
ncbi:MAG TPA: M13 family metallopeptidase N-terminal domain-containing protein, partial [Silvibacterium sp.]|nr:M13 family metallopeptidase N-terminal domain-containing protein [Silvibacterium sp.]